MSTIALHAPQRDTWDMTGTQTYGALLRRKREDRGLNQDEVGDRIGRDKSYVSRMENGRGMVMPDPQVLRDFGQALGLTMEEQLTALGYLDDPSARGPAYTVAPDDPRADLLDLVAGLPAEDIRAAIRLLDVVLTGYVRRRTPVVQRTEDHKAVTRKDRAEREQLA
jgi:transcriptional regulator with XRE-family HTH domain